MKKVAIVLAVMILAVSLVSVSFAAHKMEKGTIKSVDAKAGTVVFCPEGTNKDVTLKADKSVDLSTLKGGEKVEAMIDKHELKGVKVEAAAAPAAPAPAAKPKAAVGC